MTVKRKPTSKSDARLCSSLLHKSPGFTTACCWITWLIRANTNGISTALSSKGEGYRRALKYMRAFAAAWTDRSIVQEGLAQIPWFHKIALLEKLSPAKDVTIRKDLEDSGYGR